MPPAPPGDSERNHSYVIEGAPPRYVYIHTLLPNSQFFTHDAYAKDCKYDNDFIPDLLTDHRPSTGWYIFCCEVMQIISILQMKATFWVNMTVKTRIKWREQDIWVLSLSTISRHFTVYYKGDLCVMESQWSDKGERTWRG
jgi:hypothetical protein